MSRNCIQNTQHTQLDTPTIYFFRDYNYLDAIFYIQTRPRHIKLPFNSRLHYVCNQCSLRPVQLTYRTVNIIARRGRKYPTWLVHTYYTHIHHQCIRSYVRTEAIPFQDCVSEVRNAVNGYHGIANVINNGLPPLIQQE